MLFISIKAAQIDNFIIIFPFHKIFLASFPCMIVNNKASVIEIKVSNSSVSEIAIKISIMFATDT